MANDLDTFYCGNCKQFGKCGTNYPSTGKTITGEDVACFLGFQIVDNPPFVIEHWHSDMLSVLTWVESILIFDAIRNIGTRMEQPPLDF